MTYRDLLIMGMKMVGRSDEQISGWIEIFAAEDPVTAKQLDFKIPPGQEHAELILLLKVMAMPKEDADKLAKLLEGQMQREACRN